MGNKFAAIVLSAGLSTRMGLFKPLLPLGGKPVLERVVNEIKIAGIENIVVVTGYQSEKLEPLLKDLKVRSCFNEKYRQGMYTSLQSGVRNIFAAQISKNTDVSDMETPAGFFMSPVDCPLISAEVYIELIKAAEKDPKNFAVVCHKGKNGHPLYVPAAYVEEILQYSGELGMKYFMKKYAGSMNHIEIPYPEILWDMDDLEAYQRMCIYFDKIKVNDSNQTRKVYLIRHGEILQHEAPILLGQKNVPLSNLGKTQAKEAGKRLLALAPSLQMIYTSDLLRASETAKLIAALYPHKCTVKREKDFREINLGEWDGLPIAEIKKAYPDEFRKRGEDLLHYHVAGGGENFFELQRRAAGRLEDIMKKTDGEIAIVTHGGVIRAIAAHLLGFSVKDLLEMKIANGRIITLLWTPEKTSYRSTL
jgi:broad specificity phosphatase PhoE/CTP:molybdopterin cytidylyltransferase MocA